MNNTIKDIFSIILFGFLFGIDLSISLFASFYSMQKTSRDALKSINQTKELEITWHEDISSSDRLQFKGGIKNNGKEMKRFFELEVEFYNKDVFIYESRGQIESKIEPGEEENFILICKNRRTKCEDEYDIFNVEYDSYKIYINSAY